MQKAITDKSSALKVAHTRLESRIHRPAAELCKDHAQLRYSQEIYVKFNNSNRKHL